MGGRFLRRDYQKRFRNREGFQCAVLFFGILAFIGIPAVAYFGKKLNYARTEYGFFEDRLEFEEGFFTINKKVIKYSNIKEITLRKGVFQRMYGLGTVYLATLANRLDAELQLLLRARLRQCERERHCRARHPKPR